MIKTINGRALIVGSGALLFIIGNTGAQTATVAPSASDDNLLKTLVLRLDTRTLYLESSGGSRRDAFEVSATLRHSRDYAPTEVLVVTNGKQTVVLTTTTTGLPIYYSTDGLMVTIDRSQPGTLVVAKDSGPMFQYGIDSSGKFQCAVGLSWAPTNHVVKVDFASVLKALDPYGQSGKWDAGTKKAEFRTRHTDVAVVLSDMCTNDQCLLKSIDLSHSGGSVHIRNIEITSMSNESLPRVLVTERLTHEYLLNITINDIEALGLPISWDTKRKADAALVPSDFGKNPKELETAKKLQKLFEKKGTAQ